MYTRNNRISLIGKTLTSMWDWNNSLLVRVRIHSRHRKIQSFEIYDIFVRISQRPIRVLVRLMAIRMYSWLEQNRKIKIFLSTPKFIRRDRKTVQPPRPDNWKIINFKILRATRYQQLRSMISFSLPDIEIRTLLMDWIIDCSMFRCKFLTRDGNSLIFKSVNSLPESNYLLTAGSLHIRAAHIKFNWTEWKH